MALLNCFSRTFIFNPNRFCNSLKKGGEKVSYCARLALAHYEVLGHVLVLGDALSKHCYCTPRQTSCCSSVPLDERGVQLVTCRVSSWSKGCTQNAAAQLEPGLGNRDEGLDLNSQDLVRSSFWDRTGENLHDEQLFCNFRCTEIHKAGGRYSRFDGWSSREESDHHGSGGV